MSLDGFRMYRDKDLLKYKILRTMVKPYKRFRLRFSLAGEQVPVAIRPYWNASHGLTIPYDITEYIIAIMSSYRSNSVQRCLPEFTLANSVSKLAYVKQQTRYIGLTWTMRSKNILASLVRAVKCRETSRKNRSYLTKYQTFRGLK